MASSVIANGFHVLSRRVQMKQNFAGTITAELLHVRRWEGHHQHKLAHLLAFERPTSATRTLSCGCCRASRSITVRRPAAASPSVCKVSAAV